MNVAETVVETASSASSISGTITVAAGSVVVAVVAVEDITPIIGDVSATGWTKINSIVNQFTSGGFVYHGVFWKAAAAAGDVSITAAFTESGSPKTCDNAILHLLEVSDATSIGSTINTDYAYSYGTDGTSVPETASVSRIAVAREGNVVIFTTAFDDVATAMTEPSGYTVAAETDVGTAWCLGTYWDNAPYATSWTTTATPSVAVDWSFFHVSVGIEINQSAMLGAPF